MPIKIGPRDPSKADIALGKKIRSMRDERNISQTVLGNHLGVTFQQIQKYERGVNRVTASRLQKLAAFFKVGLADFYAPDSGVLVNSIIFEKDPRSIRLLTAYSRIKNVETQHRIVFLAESIANGYE